MLEMMNVPQEKKGSSGFEIAKFGLTYYSIHILSESGNLYGISSFPALSGVGVATTSWTLMTTGVEDFYPGYNSILIKYSSGSWGILGANLFEVRQPVVSVITDVTANMNAFPARMIKQVDINYYTLAVLYTDGGLAVCGRNSSGGLGLGDTTARTSLTLVSDLAGITKVELDRGGSDSTWVISGYEVYGSGLGSAGQFGGGSTSNTQSFKRILNPLNSFLVTDIKAGDRIIYIVGRRNDGSYSIAATGSNISGQGGQPSTTTNITTLTYTSGGLISSVDDFYVGFRSARIIYSSIPRLIGSSANSGWGLATSPYYTFTQFPGKLWGEFYQSVADNSYLLSGGVLYGAGNSTNGKLPGYTSAQTTFVPLNLEGLE